MATNSEFQRYSSNPLCGNCCQTLKETSRTTLNIGGMGFEEVQIIDAISYIYGISWEEFFGRSKITDEENFLEKLEPSCHLCESCALLLLDNYIAHKKFENVSHPSSIIQQLNSFRLKAKCHSVPENEIDENCHFPFDNDYHDDEGKELVDSYNFEKDTKDESEIEVKFEVFEEGLPQNPTVEEKFSNSNHEPRITRNSLRLQKQVVIKLERLSGEDLRQQKTPKISSRKQAPSTARKNSSSRKMRLSKKCSTMNLNTDEMILVDSSKVPRKFTQISKGWKVKCKVCGRKLKDVHHYRYKHLPMHFGKGFRKTCEICGKVFNTRRGFGNHMKMAHVPNEEKLKLKIACEICGTMVYETRLEIHMKSMHAGPRENYKCDKCEKEYLCKQNFDEHVLIHSENFTPHLCGQCGNTFSSKQKLLNHEKVHSAEKKHQCNICSRMFRLSTLLKTHLLSHSTERKHVCDECGKTFKYPRHLAEHLQLHKEMSEKGEGNVKCEECGKFFRHSLSLYKHKSRLHRPDLKKKVYKCSFCGKTVSSAAVLKTHENLHRNNPEYQSRKKQTWKDKINSENNVIADRSVS